MFLSFFFKLLFLDQMVPQVNRPRFKRWKKGSIADELKLNAELQFVCQYGLWKWLKVFIETQNAHIAQLEGF